jgi:hypothetical protein
LPSGISSDMFPSVFLQVEAPVMKTCDKSRFPAIINIIFEYHRHFDK